MTASLSTIIHSLIPHRRRSRRRHSTITPRSVCWLSDAAAIGWLSSQWGMHITPSWLTVLIAGIVGASTVMLVMTQHAPRRRHRSTARRGGGGRQQGGGQRQGRVVPVEGVPELRRGTDPTEWRRVVDSVLGDEPAEPAEPEWNVLPPYATVEQHREHLHKALEQDAQR